MEAQNISRCALGALALLFLSCCLAGCGSSDSPAKGRQTVNADNCFLIDASPSATGCEDVISITEDILITGEVDFHTLWGGDANDGDPLNAKPGNLQFIDASDPSQPTLTRMSRIDFPEGVDFHPHGMYYLPRAFGSTEANLLHVVNHAYTRGGERIDVFSVAPEANESSTPEATWLYAWTNNFFTQNANGVLNDLAVVDAEHLFVTRYLDGEGEQGRKAGSATKHYRDWFVNGSRTTEFYYCTRNAVEDTSDCVVVDGNFGMANGINFGNDQKDLLYVNDVYEQQLVAYRLDTQANNGATRLGAVELPHMADNIEWNQAHQRLFLGTIGGFGWGGADEFVPDPALPTSNASVSTRVLDDGSRLQGISSADYANGNMFMGSHCCPGVLVCPTTLAAPQWVV